MYTNPALKFELYPHIHADVVELVDTHDSKSCAAMRVGSIPTIGTMPLSHLIFDIIIHSGLIITAFVAVFLLKKIKSRNLFSKVVLIISLISFSLLFWGSYIEPRIVIVKHEQIDLPDIEESFTIAFLADYQVGPYKGTKFVEKTVRKILAEKPDLVFIGGDHIDNGGSTYDELSFLNPLKNLAEQIPTYAINGNHEYGIGTPDPKQHTEDLSKETKEHVEKLGIRYLVNELEEVQVASSSFYVYGQDSFWSGNATFDGLEDRTKDIPTILLSHNPAISKEVEDKKIDLMLFGHTHGGQIRFPFIGPILRVDYSFPKHWDKGWFEHHKTKAYTTSGVGESLTRARLFNVPEIVIFEVY